MIAKVSALVTGRDALLRLSTLSPHMQSGMTVLMMAAKFGYEETVSKLIASGASMDIADDVSNTNL